MRRIFWDTMVHAYWFEDSPQYGRRVQQIYKAMLERGDTLCSSLFVLGEILVGPIKTKDTAAANAIEQFFLSSAVTLLPFPPQAARIFAELRALYSVKALDALHLSIASAAGVDLFLTNDRRLHKLTVPGIQFIATLEADIF